MIIAFLPAFLILYFILRHFQINQILSIGYSLGIIILSPQVFRLSSHFALSYAFFIPLTWYLLVRLQKSKVVWKWGLFLLVNIGIWFFTHAYLGMMAAFFVLSFGLIKGIYSIFHKVNFTKKDIALIIAAILPVIFFKTFVELTDSHIGRTNNPAGFLGYTAELDDVFVPNHPPLKPIIEKLIQQPVRQELEARSYVGLLTIVLILVFFYRGLFRKKRFRPKDSLNKSLVLSISLLASIILLLFAFAFPFKDFPVLLDSFPIIKQFRATGRFTWFFYFVVTVWSATYFQQFIDRIRSKDKSPILVICLQLAPILLIIEGIPYHQKISSEIQNSPNFFSPHQLTKNYQEAMASVNVQKYQSIIPLPHYYIGSENFSRPIRMEVARHSMVLAYHLDLEICGAFLTRTGIEESKRIISLFSPAFYPKEIRDDFPSQKPFLLVKSWEELSDLEEQIWKKSHVLYESHPLSLAEISFNAVFEQTNGKIIRAFLEKSGSLYKREDFLISDATAFLFYESFENETSPFPFRGKGGLSFPKKGNHQVYSFPSHTFESGTEYNLSCWMYNGQPDALNLYFRGFIDEVNKNGEIVNRVVFFPEHAQTIVGDWSMVTVRFQVMDPKNTIIFRFIGKDPEKNTVYLDDLLVHENGVNVYKPVFNRNGKLKSLFWNNHVLEARF